MSRKFKSQASSSRAVSGAFPAPDGALGTFGGGGGGGFGSVSSSPLSYVYEPPDLSTVSEPNVVVTFKNLQKKDSTTKAKALEDLLQYVSTLQKADGVENGVLEAWIKVYPRTSIDTARRVRQLAHQLQGTIAHTSGKRFARYMPDVVGPWLAGLFDGDKTTSRTVHLSFKQVFHTEGKVENVWIVYLGPILQYCTDAVFKETVHTLSDERTVSPDDASAKHARVVAAAIYVVRYVIENVPEEGRYKQQDKLNDFLGRKELWKFASHPDPFVRRAVCRLLDMAIIKKLEAQNLETGTALEYARVLAHLTQYVPTVWTDHYIGTGKKTATKRLCHFLARGSQGGSSPYWDEIKILIQNIPMSVMLPQGDAPDEKFAVVEALRNGVSNRDEPRSNQHAAWNAYLQLIQRLSSDPGVSRDELIKRFVMPILTHYISPSRETLPWTILDPQQPIVLDAVRIALTSEQVFTDDWQTLSTKIIQDLQTSLPEQSKDFIKSQDAVSAEASRWYNLQAALSKDNIAHDIKAVMTEASVFEVQSAIALLKTRNGKPYGAASLIETAIRALPYLLMSENRVRDAMADFVNTDVPSLFLSPAGPYLIDLIPWLGSILEVNTIYRSSLNTVLQAPENQAKHKALQRLAASPCLARLDQDQELLASLISSLKHAVSNGTMEDDIFRTAIANPDAPSKLVQDLLAQLFEDLSLDEHQSTSLKGLEAVVKHRQDVLKAYDVSSDASALLAKLISLAQSPDEAISQRAKSIGDILRTNASADPSQNDQRILGIIRHGLDSVESDALSVTLLVDLASKTLQNCEQADKTTLATQLLPDESRWQKVLGPFLTSLPNPSLAIMNLVGNAVSLVEPAMPSETVAYDKDGHSAAFRMLWFTSALAQASDVFARAAADRRSCVIRNLAVILQIASDHLSIQSSNSLWEAQDIESEEDIIDIISHTQRLMATWLADGSIGPFLESAMSRLLDDSHGLSVGSYYSSRAYISTILELAELQTHLNLQGTADELKAVKETANLFSAAALISTIQDLTALTRTFNELLAGLTGKDLSVQSQGVRNLVMLNTILDRQDFRDVLPGIPKQRLVFFVQHVCNQLLGLLEGDDSSELESMTETFRLTITAEIMRALNHILPALNGTYGSFWEDILTALTKTWSLHRAAPDEKLPLIHASLRLHSTLVRLTSRESNDDLLDAMRIRDASISSGMIELLVLQSVSDESHQPRKIINELLARQISKINGSIDSATTRELFPALASESHSLQGAAYELLHRDIPTLQENVSLDKALSKDYVATLPEELLSLILEVPTLDILADESFKRSVPSSLRTYLLSWQLVFDHWNSASDAVKNDYVSAVKDGSYINGLLGLASDFLITSRTRPIDASKFDIDSYKSNSEDIPEKDAQWHLIHLYYLALKNLPTLSKAWWRDGTSRQPQIAVESWTEKHISPLIIASELAAVSAWAPTVATSDTNNQPLTVKTSSSTREITASIPIDEQAMSITITLPPSYPLSRATVSGLHRVGVDEKKWRSWIITTQGVINFSNLGGGNQLIDGLMAWRKNVTATLKGQKECAICYSVFERQTKDREEGRYKRDKADEKLSQKFAKILKVLGYGRSLLKEHRDLPILFPYPRIYPGQVVEAGRNYMCDLKRTLGGGGHCVLEMPSGTGKTVSLLSLIVAYQQYYPEHRKLIYCSRTMSEIEKALAELKALMKYRADQLGYVEDFRGLGLTSRKNLCLHPSVKREKSGSVVDARCRSLTAGFVKEKKERGEDVDVCIYHDNLDLLEPHNLVPPGVFTLDGMLKYSEQHKQCPYFSARRMMPFCNVIIYSYHYLLDPKIAERVSKELSKDCIVVFDEAHNIDNVCIESLSIDLTEDSLRKATRGANNLERKITEMRSSDAEKLQNEYSKLVEGLRGADEGRDENAFMANPALPDDLLQEAVPGNIRRAEHFVAFLKRFIEYLKTRMKVLHVISETPPSFLQHLKELTFIERKPLRFCAERLTSLVRTLELTNIEDYQPLQEVATFATLAATYDKGFLLILEPYESDTATVPNPILHFTCLDAAIAIKPVFDRFSSVIITSGTISPLEMYPKMLGFTAVVQESYSMTLARSSFLPMIVTRGSDQSPISSSFQIRNEPGVVRNYGSLLTEFSKITPDGLVVFFPSYLYMESIISMWQGMGILDEIWKHKLILVETPDSQETSLALETYRTACCNGRGAILLCVARGKVSEGIDFDHHYGRTVLCIGVPFQYTESRILKARLEFLRETYRIRENDFLSFDAMRHAAQCLGRVLRGKDDYGIMVLADRRFAKKRSQLPKWINQAISEEMVDVSTESAVVSGKRFMRVMAQPFSAKDQDGISTWSAEDLERHKERAEEEKIRELRAGRG
ncbi:MAG: hypothetical protein Q9181_003002, partial [Wetmoreana brouardii]